MSVCRTEWPIVPVISAAGNNNGSPWRARSPSIRRGFWLTNRPHISTTSRSRRCSSAPGKTADHRPPSVTADLHSSMKGRMGPRGRSAEHAKRAKVMLGFINCNTRTTKTHRSPERGDLNSGCDEGHAAFEHDRSAARRTNAGHLNDFRPYVRCGQHPNHQRCHTTNRKGSSCARITASSRITARRHSLGSETCPAVRPIRKTSLATRGHTGANTRRRAR